MAKRSQPAEPTEWLYTIEDDRFYMLPITLVNEWEDEERESSRIREALTTCRTWGDVYRLWPDGRERVADTLGVDVDDTYADNEAFAIVDFPEGGIDAHDIRYGMLDVLPDSIIDDFGDVIETMVDGDFVELEASSSADILAACSALGLVLTASDRLAPFILV